MGKKKMRKARKSQGVRNKINPGIVQAVNAQRTVIDKLDNIVNAWKNLQNPWITIENPTKQTNMPFIRVRTNDYWGSPRFVKE